jgi:hypothetical protein
VKNILIDLMLDFCFRQVGTDNLFCKKSILMRKRKVEHVLWGELVPVGRGRVQGKGVGGENGGNIAYSCMKMGKQDLLNYSRNGAEGR